MNGNAAADGSTVGAPALAETVRLFSSAEPPLAARTKRLRFWTVRPFAL